MSLIPYRRNSNGVVHYYNPFRMMEDMEREFFRESRTGSFSTDIRETENEYVLEADLPGFKKEDINIDIQDNSLCISAERHAQQEEKDEAGNYIRRERSYGSFSRSFSLEGVNTDAIKAAFTDGVLTLTLPKQTEPMVTGRRLQID
ncbi:MAG: Hsp20/alpha crystallin family protein [Oscillospiraceae bacterium]|nr:Hsp20/alpha crystallin family protein [Oscillospiraceae bacterium]